MHPAAKKSRKLWTRTLAVLAALLIAAVGGIAWAYPSVAATTCPGCYGLTELQPGIHTEPNLSPQQQSQVTRTVEQSRKLIEAFYGSRMSDPSLLICLTESCYQRIGGGKERGIAVLNRAVMLSPRGVDAVIASHEMSHVELHTRLTSGAEIPQWFDEGLAVVVSNDPRYLAPATPPSNQPQSPAPTSSTDQPQASDPTHSADQPQPPGPSTDQPSAPTTPADRHPTATSLAHQHPGPTSPARQRSVPPSSVSHRTAPDSSTDRCLVAPTGPLPVTLEEWLSTASKDPDTYAKAACQVSRWLRDHQGSTGLLSLIARLNAGDPFTAIVRLT